MSLVSLIVCLVIIGVVMYLVNTLPIQAPFKTIINVVVVLAVCLWLLESFGFWHGHVLRFH